MGRLLDAAEKRALDVECARHPVPARPAARLAAMAPTGDKPLPGPMGRNTPRCSFCHGVVEVTPDGRFAPHVHPDTGRACPISGTDVAATKLWRPLVPSAWTAPGGARFGLVMHDPSDGAFCFHLFDGRWFQGSTTLPTLEAVAEKLQAEFGARLCLASSEVLLQLSRLWEQGRKCCLCEGDVAVTAEGLYAPHIDVLTAQACLAVGASVIEAVSILGEPRFLLQKNDLPALSPEMKQAVNAGRVSLIRPSEPVDSCPFVLLRAGRNYPVTAEGEIKEPIGRKTWCATKWLRFRGYFPYDKDPGESPGSRQEGR